MYRTHHITKCRVGYSVDVRGQGGGGVDALRLQEPGVVVRLQILVGVQLLHFLEWIHCDEDWARVRVNVALPIALLQTVPVYCMYGDM